ncbi:MAG: hypothetical protein M1818_004149 [Claussenomyces sp. TS43310]|nr:MAG: hypothetical protein M1818_004149 [Claussenomyces sp. TS43310]
MRPERSASVLAALGLLIGVAEALVTLGDVAELANLTRDCRAEMAALRERALPVTIPVAMDLSGVGEGEESRVMVEVEMEEEEWDPEEVEDVVTAAIRTVDGRLLEILNVPPRASPENDEKTSRPWSVLCIAFPFFGRKDNDASNVLCNSIVADYHSFLEATTLFLREVEIKQLYYAWGSESTVFEALAWLQALWASRKPNEQHRSFIEQQMDLYRPTQCFSNINQDVLRHDIELVEYMNDLIDSFPGSIIGMNRNDLSDLTDSYPEQMAISSLTSGQDMGIDGCSFEDTELELPLQADVDAREARKADLKRARAELDEAAERVRRKAEGIEEL